MMVAVLLVVVLVLAALVAGRRDRPFPVWSGPHALRPPPAIRDVLARAVAAGIVTQEQAVAVVALEAEVEATPPKEERRGAVPPAIEAFGYLGAVLVIVGGVLFVSRSWEDLATAGRAAVLGATALALTTAGMAVRDEEEPVLWRLRNVVLLLASGATAGFATLIVVDGLDVTDGAAGALVGLAVVVHAGLLWWRRDRPAQHLACLLGVVAVVVGTAVWAGAEGGVIGLALWVLAAGWLAASRSGLLPPAPVGVLAASILFLVAASVTAGEWRHVGVVLGLLTAGGLVAAGIAAEEFAITAVGVVGTMIYLPSTVSAFFGSTVGIPVALLVTGAALLAVMVRLLRRRSGGLPPPRAVAP